MNFIDWNTLDFKKQSGKEKLRCPACDDKRTNRKDRSLLINHNEGYGKCFYCEALTFKNSKENQYTEISQVSFKSVLSNEKLLSYTSSRKISEDTLKSLYVSFESYYQPAKGKEMDNIVFNYYEGSKLVNKKFRSGSKDFTQISGGKPILYNINSALGAEELFIVEGEFDVLALVEFGVKNVVSVPNGANDNDEYWENSKKYISEVKRFVLGFDNDEKGEILREKVAQRLGRYRCEYIEWNGKDANDDLVSGTLKKSIKNRKKFPVNGTIKVQDIIDGVYNLYDNGLPKTITPKNKCFGELKNIFSTMFGHLTSVTGIPSHGKSSFVDWYVLNLVAEYDLKASWFTPEHSPTELYNTSIIEKVIGKNFWGKVKGISVPRITKNEINEYQEWANERLYFTDAGEKEFPTWKWLFDTFYEQMYAFGINVFVIDAFNKLILPKGNKLEEIQKVLTKLTHFAKVNHVMIFLVAHPTKMIKREDGTYSVPTLYDISGSADFRNITHDGFTIYRYFENEEEGVDDHIEFINMKNKFKYQGQIGQSIKFEYSDINGRFYIGEEPLESLLIKEKEVEQLPLLDVSDAFDDLPF